MPLQSRRTPARTAGNRLNRLKLADQNAITEFAQKLHRKFGGRIHFIKLFGSKAKGEDERFSDIDLFVVMDRANETTRSLINRMAVDIDLKYDVVLSPIVYSLAKYKDPRQRVTPFFRNVLREGIAV